jgi:L-ascorbate metabolism protein UlaG (beta-lactamase superfamily)
MQIQLIRSATLRLSVVGQTFLIDPWLAAKSAGRSYAGKQISPLVDLPMSAEAVIAGIDAVVVSHLHSDHFDEAARSMLRRDIPILCHERDAEAIRAFQFSDVRAITNAIAFGPVTISVTSGLHGPPEVLDDMGDVVGFVFRAPDEPTLYWAGDSILCGEVRDAIMREAPDVIVVHACGATWNGNGPLVMDAKMAFETVHISGTATVIATHLDAVDHATVSRADLRAAAKDDAVVRLRLRIPEDGEILRFTAPA